MEVGDEFEEGTPTAYCDSAICDEEGASKASEARITDEYGVV